MGQYTYTIKKNQNDSLEHSGVIGMKWGVRRYQNEDGTLTPEGIERYRDKDGKVTDEGKEYVQSTLLDMFHRGKSNQLINFMKSFTDNFSKNGILYIHEINPNNKGNSLRDRIGFAVYSKNNEKEPSIQTLEYEKKPNQEIRFLPPIKHSEEDENYLAHYGVKGMKWGVINEEEVSSKISKLKERITGLTQKLADNKIRTDNDSENTSLSNENKTIPTIASKSASQGKTVTERAERDDIHTYASKSTSQGKTVTERAEEAKNLSDESSVSAKDLEKTANDIRNKNSSQGKTVTERAEKDDTHLKASKSASQGKTVTERSEDDSVNPTEKAKKVYSNYNNKSMLEDFKKNNPDIAKRYNLDEIVSRLPDKTTFAEYKKIEGKTKEDYDKEMKSLYDDFSNRLNSKLKDIDEKTITTATTKGPVKESNTSEASKDYAEKLKTDKNEAETKAKVDKVNSEIAKEQYNKNKQELEKMNKTLKSMNAFGTKPTESFTKKMSELKAKIEEYENKYSTKDDNAKHAYTFTINDSLEHSGIIGMRWGIRRYQNEDGSLTDEGKERYGKNNNSPDKIASIAKNEDAAVVSTITDTAQVIKDTGNLFKKKGKNTNPYKTEYKKQKYSKITDQEMQNRIKRMQLENQYADLVGDNKYVRSGAEKAREVLQTAGSIVALTGAVVSIATKVKQIKSGQAGFGKK